METETILQQLGYTAFNKIGDQPDETLLYYRGPDGTIRWLWPAGSTEPYFLKFYHQGGWRAKVFVKLVQVIFLLRLQRVVFNRIQVTRQARKFTSGQWAAFTGTPGPNRKLLVYEYLAGSALFNKIPLGENAGSLLRNEAAALQRLSSMTRTFSVPTIEKKDQTVLRISDIGALGKSISQFDSAHVSVLRELHEQTRAYTFLHALPVWEDTCQRLQQLERGTDSRIPPALLRKIRLMVHTFATDYVVETSLAHGDFTPWNMYKQKDGSLAVFDWELSRPSMPFGFDAFHYIIQNGILTQRNSWKEIEREISRALFQERCLLGNYTAAQQRTYLTLYLIINTVYYLTVYTQQPIWHRQVNWLLETWSMALSKVAAPSMSHRKLMLMDLADRLYSKRYAAMKYGRQFPENLPEESDLDLCMPHSVYKEVRMFLDRHPLISHRKRTVQSFMTNELLVFLDGSMLSLDCIWKFKRKQFTMMRPDPILTSSFMNPFGVRVASQCETARFVGLFYALNGSHVPVRYEYLQTSLPITTALDRNLRLYYRKQITSDAIINGIKNQRQNSGIRSLINYMFYGLDVISRLLSRSAPVITFSGVDGAGKSTIIENIRIRIEKQLRKPVVVLRHRPSLFPILSAFTKGKAAAERAAAESLPRQGMNTSFISSLIRFGYYYLDYLIGQWFIWFRYSLRGHVVLYDRYYFDFIHDSRRSNIDLPSRFIRSLYALIRKPDLNFFLFAAPDIIRTRKQELDVDTIRELTEQYRTFFQRLGKQRQDQYVTIENTDLTVTTNIIMKRVMRIAA
jgi:thymidylate kinase